jgi:hypothetical protein
VPSARSLGVIKPGPGFLSGGGNLYPVSTKGYTLRLALGASPNEGSFSSPYELDVEYLASHNHEDGVYETRSPQKVPAQIVGRAAAGL